MKKFMNDVRLESPLKLREALVVCVFLLITVIILYGSALNGHWRWDDARHLSRAIEYSAWQYFFIPDITAETSGYQLTPWNVFVYDINLALFGLRPFWFYFHHLISLWFVSVSTYILVRNWYSPVQSFYGTFLFLIGSPVFTVSQQLMTGHYIYGLLFASIMIHLYILSLRNESLLCSLLSSIFYLLSISCKEVYVPFILLLPFIPEGLHLTKRIRYFCFHVLVITGYILWRYEALGSLVGPLFQISEYDLNKSLDSVTSIFYTLFGASILSYFVAGCILILLLRSIITHKISITTLLIGFFVMFFPLYRLIENGEKWMGSNRYLFAFWWLLCIIIMNILFVLKNKKILYLSISLLLSIVVAIQSAKQVQHDMKVNLMFDAHYNAIFNARPPVLIYTELAFPEPNYLLMGLLDFKAILKKLDMKYNNYWPFLSWTPSDDEIKRVEIWDEECLCMKKVIELPDAKRGQVINQMRLIGNPRLALFYNIPPRPLINQKGGGFVDSIKQIDSRVEIRGWLQMSDRFKKNLFLMLDRVPKSYSITKQHREDIEGKFGDNFSNSGFLISLEFKDEEDARRTISNYCIIAMGFEPERYILSLLINLPQDCDGFLK